MAEEQSFKDSKTRLGFDEYGFPATAIANMILLEQDDYGGSGKKLEEAWLEWLHYYPFDAAVAGRLSELMRGRFDRIDEESDAARRQVLERKLQLVSKWAERYGMESFIEE